MVDRSSPCKPGLPSGGQWCRFSLKSLRVAGLASGLLALTMAFASAAYSATLVGTKLVLSVDVSGSINASEFNLQRQGYANAFRNTDLIQNIGATPGGIAVAFSYWATRPTTTLDWVHLTDAASVLAFADAIEATPRPGTASVGEWTNIAGAMDHALTLFNTDLFTSDRRILDISGDGIQNRNREGTAGCGSVCLDVLSAARQDVLDQGIVINGLPILGDPQFPDLDDYFANNVIGGTGSFMQVASSFDDFETAALAKIQREITEPPIGVPEPMTTGALMVFGLVGLGVAKRQGFQG